MEYNVVEKALFGFLLILIVASIAIAFVPNMFLFLV